MSSEPSLPSADTVVELAVNSGFTQGGDLVLRSLDGVEFHVHSVILSLASPVLADMFQIGTQNDIVPVAETAVVLALVLSFIYPRSPRLVSSFEMLRLGMHAADKYQLEDMKNRLRERLTISGSPVSISTNPLAALAFATAHGFDEEVKLASSLASEKYDFRTVDHLVELAGTLPSLAPFVQITGVPSARVFILFNVLFSFQQEPMVILAASASLHFLCQYCKPKYQNIGRHSTSEWLAWWSRYVFEVLNRKPISECSEMFKAEFIYCASAQSKFSTVGEPNCACPSSIIQNRGAFNSWAEKVRKHLVDRLAELNKLRDL